MLVSPTFNSKEGVADNMAGGPPFEIVPSHTGTWVPRPCVFCKGGTRCCLYHFVCHAQRTASHLRRRSPALYHLFLLSAIAFSAYCPKPRPIPLHSGTDSRSLPLRGRRMRRHARTHSLALRKNREERGTRCINSASKDRKPGHPSCLQCGRRAYFSPWSARQTYCKSRALVGRRIHLDDPLVGLHDFARDIQADTKAGLVCATI